MSSSQVTHLWPFIISEMLQVFLLIEKELECGSDDNKYVSPSPYFVKISRHFRTNCILFHLKHKGVFNYGKKLRNDRGHLE